MKLTVEIENDNLTYSYEVGKSKANGTMPFSPDSLFIFADLLKYVQKNTMKGDDEYRQAFTAYTFCQAFPDLIEKVKKRIKK